MKDLNEDDFLKICYPKTELFLLKSVASRLGCYPEIFSDKYKIEIVIDHLEITVESFNDVIFRLSIFRKPYLKINQVVQIILFVDSTFSLKKRNLERSYYFKQKYKPEHVSDIDSKYQKSA
ncbi:MAG: hypothetical protein ACEQSR_04295 [Candidatus Methylacidiphilales bacterium]